MYVVQMERDWKEIT